MVFNSKLVYSQILTLFPFLISSQSIKEKEQKQKTNQCICFHLIKPRILDFILFIIVSYNSIFLVSSMYDLIKRNKSYKPYHPKYGSFRMVWHCSLWAYINPNYFVFGFYLQKISYLKNILLIQLFSFLIFASVKFNLQYKRKLVVN